MEINFFFYQCAVPVKKNGFMAHCIAIIDSWAICASYLAVETIDRVGPIRCHLFLNRTV